MALRESRDLNRLITDNLPAVICYLDSEQRYRFVNRVLEEWYDRPAEEILGRTVADLTGPEVYDQIRPYLEAAVAGKEQRFELSRTFPDGITRTLANAYVPHFNESGEVQGFFALVRDVTEQKRGEEQLRQAQKMEAVGQLTAGVAHDFNNMLAVTWGNAELLEDELGADNPFLAALFRGTKRGADLTQRLLAFSRKQVLSPEIVSANNLIAEITGLLRRTLEEHIDIKTVTADGLWNCEVDPAQLENALVNLAINARDAMPDGGKLTIETANARLDDDYAAAQAEVTPGQYVMLAVTDTGSGMPPEVREQVFEPFFTTKDVGKGTGLGLSMVYGFVKQSDGHVTIYSEEGEGTTIKLYLPRSTEMEVAEKKPATGEVPVARGETVLVVEDDPDLRTLAVTLLGNLGYLVMEAGTAAAALEQLRSPTRVNLLLTDVMLPGGMNGRELATEVEQRVPGIQVLYMSGYTEDAIIHHGRLDADAELLQKPFRRADLARAVRSVLDGPST
jgi:PAS domain S-box-containing protein